MGLPTWGASNPFGGPGLGVLMLKWSSAQPNLPCSSVAVMPAGPKLRRLKALESMGGELDQKFDFIVSVAFIHL